MTAQEKVLIIDDEENLLNGLKRQLRGDFQVLTATGGQQALDVVGREGPVAVAICDMRMPGMDGATGLAAIEKKSPLTVRMMLTGNADQGTAIDAINKGHIYRFFSKPCPAETLRAGIEDALKHYRVAAAERQLLEQTLAGSVKMLIDVLGMVDPDLVHVSERTREWARPVARALDMPNAWRLQLAAMLAPIGRIAIPSAIREKHRQGKALDAVEREIIAAAPETTRDLIANIPRLAEVAEIVHLHQKNFDGSGFPKGGPSGGEIPLAARALKILAALAEVAGVESPTAAHFATLEGHAGRRFDPDLLARIKACLLPELQSTARSEVTVDVKALYLTEGDTLIEDLYAPNGQFLLAAGTRMTVAQARSLRNIAKLSKFENPIPVRRLLDDGQAVPESRSA